MDLHVVIVLRVLVPTLLRVAGILTVVGLLVDESFAGEEVAYKPALLHHVLGNRPDDSDNARQEALHAVVLEEDIACEELSQDASKTPNINLVIVAASKDYLRRSVGPGLHVAAKVVVNKARAAKVNDFNLASGVGLDKDIFRLKVTMDELQVVNEAKCVEDLLCDALKAAYVEVDLLLDLSVVLRILIQVVPQQLSHNEEVLFVVEVVD